MTAFLAFVGYTSDYTAPAGGAVPSYSGAVPSYGGGSGGAVPSYGGGMSTSGRVNVASQGRFKRQQYGTYQSPAASGSDASSSSGSAPSAPPLPMCVCCVPRKRDDDY